MKNDGVVIKRFSSSTNIRDCGEDLWEWLQLTRDDVYGQSSEWRRIPLIGDVPHEVWMLTYRQKRYFGVSLNEVVDKCEI